MADVKWIKFATGFPKSRKLNYIRSLPSGDTIALMWVFLVCLAGDLNENGMIYLTPEMPYTDELLADEFDMEIKTVQLGLATFQKLGMIEIVDDIICLSAWEKWQSTDKLAELREYNRLAKQKSRERQKLLAMNDVNDKSMTSQPCQDTDIDKEEDIDKEIYISIVEYLNQKAGTKYKHSTQKTRTCIHARLKEGFTFDEFKTVIDKKVTEWKGTEMEQYLRPETLFGTKFEGYLNANIVKKEEKKPSSNKFNNFTGRQYSGEQMSDMERFLLQKSMNM